MRNGNQAKIKPIISVGDMAKILGHSRARFYQLQRQQIYPMPLYDIRTKRPFYDARLQKICHDVRETGIGCNGQYILFYSPRKTSATKVQKSSGSMVQKKEISAEYQELVDTLNQMGVEVSGEQVSEAVGKLYPDGLQKKDMGVVVREVFCHFRKSM
jgi:hypothetical protein